MTSAVLMVTHKHKGIIEDSSAILDIVCRNIGNLSSTNSLSVTKSGWTSAGRLKSRAWTVISYWSCTRGGAAGLLTQIIKIDPVVIIVAIAQIDRLAPMGLDFNGGDIIRHIVIPALGKDTTTDTIKVFIRTFSVCIIVIWIIGNA